MHQKIYRNILDFITGLQLSKKSLVCLTRVLAAHSDRYGNIRIDAEQLSNELDISLVSTYKYLKELSEKEIITITHKVNRNGTKAPSSYKFNLMKS